MWTHLSPKENTCPLGSPSGDKPPMTQGTTGTTGTPIRHGYPRGPRHVVCRLYNPQETIVLTYRIPNPPLAGVRYPLSLRNRGHFVGCATETGFPSALFPSVSSALGPGPLPRLPRGVALPSTSPHLPEASAISNPPIRSARHPPWGPSEDGQRWAHVCRRRTRDRPAGAA